MLSILIPTYNANCLSLIETVYKQALSTNISFEILLADDASKDEYRKINKVVDNITFCKYLQCENNIGPAKIRNYLADNAQYPYLLFLDSDVLPANDDFIKTYIDNAKPNKAICGGFIYKRENILSDAILRFKYGMKVEEQTAGQRNKYPYHSFISMNFFIAKSAFMKVRFDESFHLGYEDTLFGMQLEQNNVEILHINNPVYHCVTETSEQFLIKIKRAVNNLIGHENEMLPYVKLLKWHNVIKKLRMQSIVAMLYNNLESKITANLKSNNPSLNLFAFYKLGYLCILHKNKK